MSLPTPYFDPVFKPYAIYFDEIAIEGLNFFLFPYISAHLFVAYSGFSYFGGNYFLSFFPKLGQIVITGRKEMFFSNCLILVSSDLNFSKTSHMKNIEVIHNARKIDHSIKLKMFFIIILKYFMIIWLFRDFVCEMWIIVFFILICNVVRKHTVRNVNDYSSINWELELVFQNFLISKQYCILKCQLINGVLYHGTECHKAS